MYSAQRLPVPAARKPPVARLDEPVAHQVAYDSWAATDADETSTGMPALDVPVNPLFAANTSAADYEGGTAYSDYSDGYAGNSRIETEDYGTASSDYLDDNRTLPRPHRNMTRRPRPRRHIPKARAKSASPIITPRKRLCVSRNFRRQSRLPLSPLSFALFGVIAFEGFQLFRGPHPSGVGDPAKEDDNQYLDINTLKGDPNDGDDE